MKSIEVKNQNKLRNIIRQKCPHCYTGNVFKSDTPLFKVPEMHRECSNCHYVFDREPGYFLGAMYISYGIAVFAGIITFLALRILAPAIPTIYIPLSIVAVIALIARINFKLSRVIYLHMFPW